VIRCGLSGVADHCSITSAVVLVSINFDFITFFAGAISLTSMQPDTKAQRKEEKRKKKKEQKTLVVDSEGECFWMDWMHH